MPTPPIESAMLALSPFGSQQVDAHLSNWSAWGWLGAIALLLGSGLLGCVAIGMSRFSYWIFDESQTAGARIWVTVAAAAVGLWTLSLWPFVHALTSLLRHSRSIQFAGWFTILGTLTIVLGYIVASMGADRLASWWFYGGGHSPKPPTYLFLVPALPAGAITLIAISIYTAEMVHREGALSVVFTLLVGAVVTIAMFAATFKALGALVKLQSGRY